MVSTNRGGELNGASLTLLNKPYKPYTEVKPIHTRSLFGDKRAFRSSITLLGKTSFDPVLTLKPILGKKTITFSNR
jgi:hypothetical protein